MSPERIVSLLLRLYPRAYRSRYGAEWREVATWHWAALAGKRFARTRLALLLVADALRSLPAAYATGGGAGGHGRTRPGDALLGDLRHGVRGLARNPLFTLAAATSLALGIGANTAIFSVVDAVLLRPLPYREPERLVVVWNEFPGGGVQRLPMSGPQVASLREEAGLFEDVAGVWSTARTLTAPDGEPVQVATGVVTPNLLAVLGVEPALGPGFVPDGSPVPRAVLLGDGLWRTRFGADPAIVGRPITVEGVPLEVAGVLPPDFRLHLAGDSGIPPAFDLYTPLPWDPAVLPAGQRFLRVVGRLRPGVDSAQAARGVLAAGERALTRHLELQRQGDRLTVHPLQADAVRAARPVLLALLGAVGLFLILASANVANLMLARAATRLRELSIRTSLGASRAGLARLLVVEAILVTGAGAALGLVVGRLGAAALWAARPAGLARAELPALNPSVLAFTLLVSLATAMVFGLTALATTRSVDPAAGLKGALRPTGPLGRRIREAVTAGEVAVGLVLLVGSALMVQSVVRLDRESVGFVPEGVLTFKLSVSEARFPGGADRAGAAAEVERRLGRIPGVTAAGGTSHLPFATWPNWTGASPPEGTPAERRDAYTADLRAVTPGFLVAAGAELLAGRLLEEGDDRVSRPVVVIDRTMARRAFGDGPLERVVGRVLEPQRYLEGAFVETPAVVVGVIEDVRDRSPARPSVGQVFWPFAQSARWELTWMVRVAGDPGALADLVRREVEAVDSRLAVSEVAPMEGYVRSATAPTRFVALLGGIFSGLSVLLATVGLYGVVAFVTLQRLPELAMRSALGAGRGRLLREVVEQGLRVGAAGVLLGTGAALVLTRFLGGLVYGVDPEDPLTLAAVGLLLLAVTVLASLAPALRATRLDPVAALREG